MMLLFFPFGYLGWFGAFLALVCGQGIAWGWAVCLEYFLRLL